MRGFAYIVFLAIAAPFEIVFSWYVGWRSSLEWLAAKPLAEGMLYFFSITLCCETIFRALGHIDHPTKARKAKPFVWLTLLLIMGLLFDFFGASWPQLMTRQSVADNYMQQMTFAFLAMILSALSYKSLEAPSRRFAS